MNPTENLDIRYSLDSDLYDENDNSKKYEEIFNGSEQGAIEKAYEEYKNNPNKFPKSYDGNVIIKANIGVENYTKMIVVDPNESILMPIRAYEITDNCALPTYAIDLIEKGEINGEVSKYRRFIESYSRGQSINRYSIRDEQRSRKSYNGTERTESFRNNGFARSFLDIANDTRYSNETEIDDELLDDAMFESLFNDGFIREINQSSRVRHKA